MPINSQPLADVASNSGERQKKGLRYLSGGPSADRFDTPRDEVVVALVNVCSKHNHHRCENMSSWCNIRIQIFHGR